jgi:uncharacterized protein YcgI (DUF1989 family)
MISKIELIGISVYEKTSFLGAFLKKLKLPPFAWSKPRWLLVHHILGGGFHALIAGRSDSDRNQLLSKRLFSGHGSCANVP